MVCVLIFEPFVTLLSKHFHVFRLHFFIPSFCSFYPLICCPSYHSGVPPNAFSGLILNMLPHRWYDTNWIVSLKKCFMEISNLDSKLCMISLTYEKSTFFFKTQQLQLLQVSILKWHWVKNSLQPAQIPVHYLPLNAESQASADTHCICFPDSSLAEGSFLRKTLELTNMMPEWVGLLTQNHNYHFKVDTGELILKQNAGDLGLGRQALVSVNPMFQDINSLMKVYKKRTWKIPFQYIGRNIR